MADSITDEGMKFIPRDTKEAYGNSKILVNIAVDFINRINEIITSYDHTYKLLSTASIEYVTKVMQQDEQKLQQIIAAQYGFQADVNNFLGRSIHFAWVSSKGEVFFASETSAERIYTSAVKQTSDTVNSGKLGSVNINSLGALVGNKQSFMKQAYQKEINQRINEHQEMYAEAVKRLKRNEDAKNIPWVNKNPSTVYWEVPVQGPEGVGIEITATQKWTWSHKTSEGDLAEGLINFIFNSKNITLNIGTFMTKWVEAHNRIPGITKGDIIIQGTYKKVQIAVKSTGTFNTASIGPYLRAAYTIITLANKLNKLTIQNVKDILDNVPMYSEKVAREGQKYLEEECDKIVLKQKF